MNFLNYNNKIREFKGDSYLFISRKSFLNKLITYIYSDKSCYQYVILHKKQILKIKNRRSKKFLQEIPYNSPLNNPDDFFNLLKNSGLNIDIKCKLYSEIIPFK